MTNTVDILKASAGESIAAVKSAVSVALSHGVESAEADAAWKGLEDFFVDEIEKVASSINPVAGFVVNAIVPEFVGVLAKGLHEVYDHIGLAADAELKKLAVK